VKPGKAARVFTMLASAMNCTIAEVMGLVFECMRRNPRFFESMVGIDMSGNGGDFLVEILSSVDPALDKLEEADVVKLDKCWAPELWDAVGLAFALVAAALGGQYVEVESLVQGLKHTHYEVKGDVFEAPWNPSGQRGTVECNGAGMSISDRYVFYRNRPELVSKLLPRCLEVRLALREGKHFTLDPADFPYRTVRALTSYGDDTLKNTKSGVVFSHLD